LADQTGSVSASFCRETAITFKGSAGDIFVAKGCIIRHYGDSYAVLNCTQVEYTLNSESDSLLFLRNIKYMIKTKVKVGALRKNPQNLPR
jgi:hypothetical protein